MDFCCALCNCAYLKYNSFIGRFSSLHSFLKAKSNLYPDWMKEKNVEIEAIECCILTCLLCYGQFNGALSFVHCILFASVKRFIDIEFSEHRRLISKGHGDGPLRLNLNRNVACFIVQTSPLFCLNKMLQPENRIRINESQRLKLRVDVYRIGV